MTLQEHINEALASQHMVDRFKERIQKLKSNEVSKWDKKKIVKNLNTVLKHQFDNKSYGIKLVDFDIKKDSPFYYEKDGREYYRINDIGGVDSTGDEVWAIVRRNKVTTLMLRKSIQPISSLGVDKIINIKDL